MDAVEIRTCQLYNGKNVARPSAVTRSLIPAKLSGSAGHILLFLDFMPVIFFMQGIVFLGSSPTC